MEVQIARQHCLSDLKGGVNILPFWVIISVIALSEPTLPSSMIVWRWITGLVRYVIAQCRRRIGCLTWAGRGMPRPRNGESCYLFKVRCATICRKARVRVKARMTLDPFCTTLILSRDYCLRAAHTKIAINTVMVARLVTMGSDPGSFKLIIMQAMMTRTITGTLYKTFKSTYLVLNSPVGWRRDKIGLFRNTKWELFHASTMLYCIYDEEVYQHPWFKQNIIILELAYSKPVEVRGSMTTSCVSSNYQPLFHSCPFYCSWWVLDNSSFCRPSLLSRIE